MHVLPPKDFEPLEGLALSTTQSALTPDQYLYSCLPDHWKNSGYRPAAFVADRVSPCIL